MIPVGLSFQQAPPISVPFRFFITAPLFLFAAAMLLVFNHANLMVSRHEPATLAATHLVTLGFTSMVMCGSLLQLFPVLSGFVLSHPIRTARLIHMPLTVGAAGIAGAFLWNYPWLMYLSITCLVGGFSALLLTIAVALWKASVSEPSLSSMRLSFVALGVTVVFGVLLGTARHLSMPVSYQILADLHPLWGLYGWTMLLIMGLAYKLVPMFQLTRNYPDLMTKHLVGALLMCIVFKTLVAWIPSHTGDGLARLFDVVLAMGAGLFAVITLRLQWQRKRKVGDTTLNFWQIALVALLMSGVIEILQQIRGEAYSEELHLAMGILVLMGFAVTVINGMLYKIVPFLTWFHLQSAYPGSGAVPNVREIQSRFYAHYQMVLHLAALTILVISCWMPSLSGIAGILWGINALWLEFNLMQAARIFILAQRVARTPGSE